MVEIRELDLPEVGDDVLVKNIYSRVCGTDMAVLPIFPSQAKSLPICR